MKTQNRNAWRVRDAEQRVISAAEAIGHDMQTCGCDICEAVLAFQHLTGLPSVRGRAALRRFERPEVQRWAGRCAVQRTRRLNGLSDGRPIQPPSQVLCLECLNAWSTLRVLADPLEGR